MGRNHKKLLNNLEEFRKSKGLTQQELSIEAEVSRKSINAIENGIYIPSTVLALGRILEGVGSLVGLIGIGTMIAGYLYPNTGKELTDAVEEFEKK